jgi:parallel beta-helix repeat protein
MLRSKTVFVTVLALVWMLIGVAYGQNYLSGVLSGTYSGVYIVNGDCQIEAGTTVTILPGTEFQFSGHYTWYVSGTLNAIGTATSNILFHREYPTQNRKWGGIRFTSSSANESVLDYCVIDYCLNTTSPNYYGGGIYANGASPTILNTKITNCQSSYGGGVYAQSSNILLDGCTVMGNTAGNGGGIYLYGCASAQVRNCIVVRNTSTST